MRARQRRTLERLFNKPTPAIIRWREVASLMDALDVEMNQRAGSRVLLRRGALRTVVHQPHPRSEIRQAAVRDIAEFLERPGETP